MRVCVCVGGGGGGGGPDPNDPTRIRPWLCLAVFIYNMYMYLNRSTKSIVFHKLVKRVPDTKIAILDVNKYSALRI